MTNIALLAPPLREGDWRNRGRQLNLGDRGRQFDLGHIGRKLRPRDVTRQFDIRHGARQRHRWNIARIRERWHVGRNWQSCHWIVRCDWSAQSARAAGDEHRRGHQGREQRNSPPSPPHPNTHLVSPLPFNDDAIIGQALEAGRRAHLRPAGSQSACTAIESHAQAPNSKSSL